MRASVSELLLVVMICGHGVDAVAIPLNCFDFTKPVTKPLMAPIPFVKGQETHSAHGMKENGIEWGAVRAILPVPIESVYESLRNHENVKDMTKTKLETARMPKHGYLDFHEVKIDVNVWAFIRVAWVEHWGYVLTEGTPEAPNEIVISYHMDRGTKYIEHECGNFVLRRKAKAETDFFGYEELKAAKRNGKDTEKMMKGIVKTILKKSTPGLSSDKPK